MCFDISGRVGVAKVEILGRGQKFHTLEAASIHYYLPQNSDKTVVFSWFALWITWGKSKAKGWLEAEGKLKGQGLTRKSQKREVQDEQADRSGDKLHEENGVKNSSRSHQFIIRSICNPPFNPSICKSNKHYVLKKKTRKKHKQPNQCNRSLNQSPVAVLEKNVYMPQPKRDYLDIIHCASRFLSSCSWWFHCRLYFTFFPSHVSLSLSYTQSFTCHAFNFLLPFKNVQSGWRFSSAWVLQLALLCAVHEHVACKRHFLAAPLACARH